MSRDDLREWSKAHNLQISHSKAVLIEQAKTKRRVKVTNRGKTNKRSGNLEGTNADNPIEIASNPAIRTYIHEDPEYSKNWKDANEPGSGSYFYDLPLAGEEPLMNQSQTSQANPEYEHLEVPNSLDNAGPSKGSN